MLQAIARSALAAPRRIITILSESVSSRTLGDRLRSDFDINSVNDVVVTIPELGTATPDDVDTYASRISQGEK